MEITPKRLRILIKKQTYLHNNMTEAEFEKSLKQWSVKIKRRAIANIHSKTETKDPEYKNLKDSISNSVRKNYGEVSSVGFGFEPQGIYLHYGVGRGYTRVGGKVEIQRKKFKQVKNKKTGKIYLYKNKLRDRKPHDWLDVEIRTGIKELANDVQEYHGDRSMQKLLEMVERMTIERK